MFGNHKAINTSKENNMLRAIILIAAVIIIGLAIAPRITAHEIDPHFESSETATWSHEFAAPRYVTVTVRGVRPTFDDGSKARPVQPARPEPWTDGRHW